MSYHQKGRTAIRDFLAGLFTFLHLSDDASALSDSATAFNPGGGRFYAEGVTAENVDANTKRYKATITSEDFPDVDIARLGLGNGASNADTLSAILRTRTIGIEAENDQAVIAIDVETQNGTPSA